MSAEKEASSPERLSGEMTRNRNSGFMGLRKLRRYYVAKSEVYQVISQIRDHIGGCGSINIKDNPSEDILS